MRISNFRKSIVFALAVLALAACNNNTELRWTEEVKLADGRIIVVKRYSEFKAPHEIGQPSGESYTRLEFEHPVTRETVKFESKLIVDSSEMVKAGTQNNSGPAIENRPYSLMMKANNLYVVTWLDASIDRFYGCPDPPFLLYIWNEGQWKRRPLEEIPHRKFIPNLTIDPLSARAIIKSSGYHLTPEQTVFIDPGYGPLVYDFNGMSQQAFDLPPNCATCTMYVRVGNKADSPKVGPFCTRPQRKWVARKHLTN